MTTNTRGIRSWFFNDNLNNSNKRADASLKEKENKKYKKY